MNNPKPQFTPCPTRFHEHPVTFCCAEPDGLRSGVPLHSRMCTVALRADKTHDGDHRNRGGETWAQQKAPRYVVSGGGFAHNRARRAQ